MPSPRLRAVDYEAVSGAVIGARQDGISLADALDIRGVLFTEKRREQIRREALVHLRSLLERESAEGLVRWRYGKTHPLDATAMFETTRSWLTMTINLILQEEVDDEADHDPQSAVRAA